ncbi:MAG: glycosyltransferase [Nitrospira sp.]|nr:glycosyltransferase [Nitrospira sp.]
MWKPAFVSRQVYNNPLPISLNTVVGLTEEARQMIRELEQYREVAPKGTIDFLYRLSDLVRDKRFLHISSVRYGGGMAEILRRIVPIMKTMGIEASWEVIAGTQEFNDVTRRITDGLQGREETITEEMYQIYLDVNARNAKALNLDADLIFVHDPQPAALVDHRKGGTWVWRCHLDAGQPYRPVWSLFRRHVLKYDAAVFSLPGFAQRLPIPKFLLYPSIDPLTEKNRELSRGEILQVLDRFGIARGKPILLQVARFDRFKDQIGTIRAYRMAKKHHPCQLILAGSGVLHDSEGEAVLAEVQQAAENDPDIHVLQLPPEADREINALQRGATIVVQRALKEGFGVAVSESMWKGKPVIGGTTGGVSAQIVDGATGFIVHSVEGAAFRIRYLLSNPGVMTRMGALGKEHVRRNFLTTRHLGDYLTMVKLLCPE